MNNISKQPREEDSTLSDAYSEEVRYAGGLFGSMACEARSQMETAFEEWKSALERAGNLYQRLLSNQDEFLRTEFCNASQKESWLENSVRAKACSSIIFSCIAAEAAINFFAYSYAKHQWQSIDKLSLTDKWLIVPQLITGRKVLSGEQKWYSQLSETVKARNKLVHPKPKTTRNELNHHYEKDDLLEYVNAANTAVTTLSSLLDFVAKENFYDRNEPLDWFFGLQGLPDDHSIVEHIIDWDHEKFEVEVQNSEQGNQILFVPKDK